MLFNAGLWAPAVARVLDTSLRYTVDKTTREILFLPLPTAIKYRAKPFVDVTMDRFAKALGALLVLVLIKSWGFGLSWQQLSFASLTLMAIWILLAHRVKREYLAAFRRSIARHDVEVAEIRAPHADLQTIELLVEELAHVDERRVLYAIELLESLEKRHLISPLLLHHSSPAVRARTLRALEALTPDVAARWLPAVERLLTDEDAVVRANAVRAIAAIRGQEAAALMRRHLTDSDPRMVVTAAVALAASPHPGDIEAVEGALGRLAADTRESAAPARLEAAAALGDIPHERIRHMLVPLMFDPNVEVARAAIRSAARIGPDSVLFVAPLVSLLRHRLLKNDARDDARGLWRRRRSSRSPTFCATSARTSGCGVICPRRWRVCRPSEPSTCSWTHSRIAMASCDTKSSRRSKPSTGIIRGSRSAVSRSKRWRWRRAFATSMR